MVRYRHKGSIHLLEKEPEPDNSWVGWVFLAGVILFLLAACGG